jgi:hypothetical protein
MDVETIWNCAHKEILKCDKDLHRGRETHKRQYMMGQAINSDDNDEVVETHTHK